MTSVVIIHVYCEIISHCWHILIITYAYALIFIHRRFGSLFWLLGVLIGSLFHKKMGPYLKAWGSLLVLETVLKGRIPCNLPSAISERGKAQCA